MLGDEGERVEVGWKEICEVKDVRIVMRDVQ